MSTRGPEADAWTPTQNARLAVLFCLTVAAVASPVNAQVTGPVREAIAARLDARVAEPDSRRGALLEVYRSRAYAPAWTDDRRALSIARELLDLVADAAREGLEPSRYPIDRARTLIERAPSADDLAELEILLSETWLSYGRDVSLGRVEPADVDSLWRRGSSIGLAEALRAALARDDPVEPLRDLAPTPEGYGRLRLALERYRALAAGAWEQLPAGPPLAQGASGHLVIALSKRLIALGDLVGATMGSVYDSSMAAAVRRFQARHGLAADGIVAGATLDALNVSPTVRARQLEANLERWRWLPRTLGDRHLSLNTPAFAGELVDGGRTVMGVRAVFGRRDWPTPIRSSTVTHVVLNPSWRVPREIAVRELLPIVRTDPSYLAGEGIEVLSEDGQSVNPDSVEWVAVSDTAFRFRFIQAPGPRNPLGPVKVDFANPFAVSLHGTPQPEQFRQLPRAFSHGCVRIDQAVELAVYLLQDQPEWSRDSILAALEKGSEVRVAVREPLPVLLTYWTAWVNSSGSVEFRDDVYGWDTRLLEALQRRPP